MDQALFEKLGQAANYRVFLQIAVENAGGVAAFSRRAQFSSRSFLSEVLRGNRRLSHSSYEKVLKALKMTTSLKKLFQLLVATEEPDVVSFPGKQSLEDRIKEARQKIFRCPDQKNLKNLIFTSSIPIVYAALGPKEKGATLDEIKKRTTLGRSELLEVLRFLVDRKLVRVSSDENEEQRRYFELGGNIDLDDLGGEIGFRRSYAATAETLKKLVMQVQSSPETLFYYTAFPIAESQLISFKQELCEILISHIERYQADGGDRVVRVNLGYFT